MTRGTAKDVSALVSAAGELVGKTRLQKTCVLLELAGVGFGFDFDYHLFGPYSEELSESANRAVALGLVEEEIRRANWGGLYSSYKAIEPGSSGNDVRDEIIQIAKDADSIVLELAATAAFLASQGVEDSWQEVVSRKLEKATRFRISAAKKLLREIAAVGTPNPIPGVV